MPTHPGERINAEVEAILNSGVLGKSDAYPRLLRYLAERSNDRPLKEIEIAIDVFGRDATFDVTQDSLVRVYMHKLRQRLDRYYQGPGANAQIRLDIPKGSYRLTTTKRKESQAVGKLKGFAAGSARWLAGGLALGILLMWAIQWLDQRSEIENLAVSHQPWLPLLQSEKPLLLVTGSYFVYSELNNEFEQLREVRNFSIHGPEQFELFLQQQPDEANRFRDMGVRYLPAGVASALADLVQMLNGQVDWQVVSSDSLATMDTTAYNIFYLGPFTGLGALEGEIFSQSNFSLHPNGFVLIDRNGAEVFANEGQLAEDYRDRYVDYALFTRSLNEQGNWLYSLMSARDAGFAHTARLLTSTQSLTTIHEAAQELAGEEMEILVEVSGTAANQLQPQVRSIRAR